jgi:rhodanese-related sulfurtransferase
MKAYLASDFLAVLALVALSTLAGFAWNAGLGERAAWSAPVQTSADGAVRVADVDFRDLAAGVRGGRFVLLDARGGGAYRSGHIPGARNLPAAADVSDLRRVMDDFRTDSRPVVVYCSGVLCEDADNLAARLHDLDPRKPIFIYRGGWEEWQANERP